MRSALRILLGGSLLFSACTLVADDVSSEKVPVVDEAAPSFAPSDGADANDAAGDTAGYGGDEGSVAGGVEGCDRKTIGEEAGPLVVAYGVEDGRLATVPCFGEPSTVVEAAWNDLAAITPEGLVGGVAIVAGFSDSGDTLAYAAPVENDSDEHLIAVAIDAAVEDPQELRLTMAHELAHVFTQTTDQIDVAVFDDECDTFFNGFGCFEVDAYITAWVDQFWPPSVIATLPADYSVDIEGGEERCELDPSFPGSYAASHPEEDFAESFSAYVFDLELPSALDERFGFFDGYPEFVVMRDAVRASGAPVPPNNFDRCG